MDRQKNSNSDVNRRTMLLAVAGAAPLIALSAGAAQAKVSPTAVAYQTTPKGAKRCDGCSLFVAPSSCKSVSGVISPHGWCRLWSKKA